MGTSGWALSTTTDRKTLEPLVESLFVARGHERVKGYDRGAITVELRSHAEGTLLLVDELSNRTMADVITAKLGSATLYLELRLEDTSVEGIRVELPTGATEDIDDEALELLNDWNEGEDRKFISEAFDGLVEALLDVGDTKKPVVLAFKSTGSPRVAGLVSTIREGGTWERTTIANQPAIRVKGPAGSQISVLTPAEEAEFLAAVGG